jgi:hypothetical protein
MKSSKRTALPKSLLIFVPLLLMLSSCVDINTSEWQNVDYDGHAVKKRSYNENID